MPGFSIGLRGTMQHSVKPSTNEENNVAITRGGKYCLNDEGGVGLQPFDISSEKI